MVGSMERIPMERLQDTDTWVWDEHHKSSDVMLSPSALAAYFHIDPLETSKGTAGVRGSKSFVDGEHYWEIRFLEPPLGTSVMVGVGTQKALLHTDNYQFVNLVGHDTESWGLSYKGSLWHNGKSKPYCAPFYDRSTVIGVYLNLYRGTLSYFINGKCLGEAVTDLPQGEPLYPMISSTSDCTELEVLHQSCRYLTLQEKCCLAIARSLKASNDAAGLPLPRLLQHQVQELRVH